MIGGVAIFVDEQFRNKVIPKATQIVEHILEHSNHFKTNEQPDFGATTGKPKSWLQSSQ
jgi:hypothetical protein